MPAPAEPPFPFDAVRDLLGVVRAIYLTAKDHGAPRPQLTRIANVGKQLSHALDLAGASQQGSSGHAAAWKITNDAMLQVCDLVDPLTPAAPLLAAARDRVSGAKVSPRKKTPAR